MCPIPGASIADESGGPSARRRSSSCTLRWSSSTAASRFSGTALRDSWLRRNTSPASIIAGSDEAPELPAPRGADASAPIGCCPWFDLSGSQYVPFAESAVAAAPAICIGACAKQTSMISSGVHIRRPVLALPAGLKTSSIQPTIPVMAKLSVRPSKEGGGS